MAYITRNRKNGNIIILDPMYDAGEEHPLGELLFSFLDLNLEEYKDVYNFIGYDNLFNYSDFQSLGEKYPDTYNQIYPFIKRIDSDADEDVLRSYSLYYLTENQDTFSELYQHPFFSYSDAVEATDLLSYRDVYEDLDFYSLQQCFTDLIEFCFISNDPKIEGLDKNERFFLFSAAMPFFKTDFFLKRTYYCYPHNLFDKARMTLFSTFEETKENITKWGHLNYKEILQLLDHSTIEEVQKSTTLVDVSLCTSLHDFLVFELHELLSSDIEVKRCKNCGKLFIPSGKYNTDCCDRIPKGEKYSCKKIMAQKRRKQKLSSDPIAKEYDRAYKRNYARVTNHKMTAEDFRLWTEEAAKKRDAFSAKYDSNPSDQLISEFKKYLGNK